MTVPDRRTAAALLLETAPPDWLVRHARAVAEVAAWLAARVAARGTTVDRRLVEAAALLHDVDKALSPDRPARALAHGEGSAAWLAERGHPELGPAVEAHPVTRLEDGERFRRWLAASSLETRIVAYADKRAGARAGADGRALRILAAALPGRLGRRDRAAGPRARGSPRGATSVRPPGSCPTRSAGCPGPGGRSGAARERRIAGGPR